jgi:murein DD-endopeptidase MepM/ murein hydrolase activator NlpD
VRFSTSSDSATSDVDFSSYSAVRNFAPGQTEDVVYVDSRTDNVNEATERFNVSISKVNNADTITTASTFGQIFNVNPTSGYIGELNSWSDTQWNWAAGDNTRITGNESGYTGRSSIQQVYNDLSTRLLGKSFNSSAGYVLDPSYYSDPNAGGRYGWHNGIDIDTPIGTPTKVKALIAGTVVSRTTIGNDPKNIFVTVQGDDGRFYVYGHLSSAVKTLGSRVGTGEILGEVGLSAASNHLHFQVNSTRHAPSGYNNRNQSHVYGWTQNPLKVFWLLRRENRI